MKKNFLVILKLVMEEIFPFSAFDKSKNRILKSIYDQENYLIEHKQTITEYLALDEKLLNTRLQEEHDRAIKIDDKTSKFILGLSLSLTILAAIAGSFFKLLPSGMLLTKTISFICVTSSCYMLIAGLISLGAFKTLPRYGYGSCFLIRRKNKGKSILAENVFMKERINIIRQIRNESSYQCIRNGLILLLLSLYLSVFSLL